MKRSPWLVVAISATFFVLGLTVRSIADDEKGGEPPINADIVAKAKPEPPTPWPHKDPNNPNVIVLDGTDKSKDLWRTPVDTTLFPKREPGPINLHRYQLHLENQGIKTFFQRPLALTQEDLKAGKIDVAMFGAPTGALPHSAGCMWAPAEIRYTRDYGGYATGKFPLSFIEYETLMNPFETLRAVDYGDAGMDPYSNARTLEDIRRVTREILEAGAIPFCVGGDH